MELRETGAGYFYELKEKTDFDIDSMRRLELTKTLGLVVGMRPGSRSYEVQAIRFDKGEWDKAKIEAWVKANLPDPAKLIEAMGNKKMLPAQALNVSTQEQKLIAVLGHTAVHKKNLKRARTIFQGLITLNPVSNLGHTGMGKVLQAEGNLDGALEAYKEALRLYPEDVDALLGTAEVHMARGKKKPALPCLLQIAAIDKDQIEPSSRKAREMLEKHFSNEDLKDYMQFGQGKVLEMAKERQKAARTGGAPAAGRPAAAPGAKPAVGPLNLRGGPAAAPRRG